MCLRTVLNTGALLFTLVLAQSLACKEDDAQCVQNLRKIMVDEDTLWFGRDFAKRCPAGSWETDCTNPGRNKTSILSRMWNTTDKAEIGEALKANEKLKLAQVVYKVPQGRVYGCGHEWSVPAVDHSVDPATVARVSSWSLDHQPDVTWEAPPGGDGSTLYTVVVWDVGYYYLHGLYVNARQSDISQATQLDAYHGPKNPFFRHNVFLFAVFRQSRYLDPEMAGRMMRENLAQNQRALSMSQYMRALGMSQTDLIAANVLLMLGDAYSMEYQKNAGILDYCPKLISQSPDLRAVLDGARINADWSEEKWFLETRQSPYLESLTVSLDVQYSMESAMTVEQCCVQTTIAKSGFKLDPLASRAEKAALTSRVPMVQISPVNILADRFNSIKDQAYTLMLVDMTAALDSSHDSVFVVHWLVHNILSADVSTGVESVTYMAPVPMQRDNPRTYVFLLLEQKTPNLDVSNLRDFVSPNCPDYLGMRCISDLSAMLRGLDLEDIAGVTWMGIQQDEYARMRILKEFNARPVVDICDGLPGYEDPCPHDQYNAGNGRAGTGRLLVSTLATAGLVFVATFLLAQAIVG